MTTCEHQTILSYPYEYESHVTRTEIGDTPVIMREFIGRCVCGQLVICVEYDEINREVATDEILRSFHKAVPN